MENRIHRSKYFCGNEISAYGLKNGYVDYRTFAKAFDVVMNNDIISNTQDIGYWEPIISEYYYEDDDGNEIDYEEYEENGGQELYSKVYQWFIVSNYGAELIQEYNVGVLYYNEKLDMYVWGITHWGTSWDYVLTDIKLDLSNS